MEKIIAVIINVYVKQLGEQLVPHIFATGAIQHEDKSYDNIGIEIEFNGEGVADLIKHYDVNEMIKLGDKHPTEGWNKHLSFLEGKKMIIELPKVRE
ncbi:hypothetical protein GOV09_00550 [Candidatus Woesearchaeota archaeon]|nr:hypothetical protein [Candidatus Woesearchaeota archaeon]